MSDTIAYCARLGTYQWVGLIVATIIVIVILILLSINYAKYINSSDVKRGTSINLDESQAKTTKALNIVSIIMVVFLLLIVILFVYGNYLKGRNSYQVPVFST
jgi:uncharacterized integral membrane protein